MQVIRKFKAGEFNVLVSTSIGEEGLDIGEVDMIVCYDAQKTPIRMVCPILVGHSVVDQSVLTLFRSSNVLGVLVANVTDMFMSYSLRSAKSLIGTKRKTRMVNSRNVLFAETNSSFTMMCLDCYLITCGHRCWRRTWKSRNTSAKS